MRRILFNGLLCSAFLLQAWGADLKAPRLGYVWDSAAQTLRAVEGIPGAAFLGDPLDLGGQYSQVAVSQKLDYALALSSESHNPVVLQIGADGMVSRAIPDALAAVDRIALSPTGTSALLYAAGKQVLQVITGLPAAPVVAKTFTGIAAGPMAVSDDGSLVLLAVGDALNPVFLAGDSDTPLSLPVSGPVSALALRPNAHGALIASSGSVTLVSGIDSDARYEVLQEDSRPVLAVSFSSDGARSIAVYADGTVSTRTLATAESSVATCPCTPDGLQPLAGRSVFALKQGGPGPLFLYDGLQNRVVFVAGGAQ